jgi:pantetheine-phosphate adenylyltransferase|tara:strand:+ start:337 stop:822 length:486 start_codon:yes stop_codon:yes gene_type:complete
MTKRIGIYPGTFDPITKGHLHIIRRASKLVDHLVVGVAKNAGKKPRFSADERLDMAQTDIGNMPDKHCEITVESFDNLLIHYAAQKSASCIFRGLRAISDFEYEFQMTGMNAKLDKSIETVFLMASDEWQFVSSSFVKEICVLGGDVSQFVTPSVLDKLKD